MKPTPQQVTAIKALRRLPKRDRETVVSPSRTYVMVFDCWTSENLDKPEHERDFYIEVVKLPEGFEPGGFAIRNNGDGVAGYLYRVLGHSGCLCASFPAEEVGEAGR